MLTIKLPLYQLRIEEIVYGLSLAEEDAEISEQSTSFKSAEFYQEGEYVNTPV